MEPSPSNSDLPRNMFSVDGVFNRDRHNEHRALGFIHLQGSSVGVEGDTSDEAMDEFWSIELVDPLSFPFASLGGDVDFSSGDPEFDNLDAVAMLREQ